ncbi:hypothetical protein, partial [Pelomonas sp. KK5]|uniref:hypothetical protein n=1 Tax=Pelomonas sp. KK5 TaxID=1855730 RepID=UPI001301CE26
GARGAQARAAQPQAAQPQVVQQPPQRPRVAPPRPRSRFNADFGPEALVALRKDLDRGQVMGIGKGLGDFADVLKKAEALNLVGTQGRNKAITELIAEIGAYCNEERRQSYDAEKKLGAKGSRITVQKYETAQAMLLEVRRLAEDGADAAFPGRGDRSSAQYLQQRQDHAARLAEMLGAKSASAGSSDVKLIKNGDNKVAYAFKSIEGETEQTTMEPGGATMRELMASAFGDAIRAQCGLDFGFPAVTAATIGNKPGALIEGLSGECFDVDGSRKELEKGERTQEETTAMRQVWENRAATIAPAELQKVMLSGLAMGNFDVKWGNMMVEADGSVRPFDAGTAFPSTCDMASAIARDLIPINLTMAPGGTDLASAQAPMDPALVAQFAAIDTNALRRTMAAARAEAARASGLAEDLVDDAAIDRALHSITIVQDILQASPQITMTDFANAYGLRMGELVSAADLQAFQALDAEDPSLINLKPREFATRLKARLAG